ncbi:MAG TPA: hypothetical protein VHZ03_49065 [Trebonia sp.]|nr:hypothetical protein [Trebonia sp.]
MTLGPALVLVIIATAIGKERKGKVFGGEDGPGTVSAAATRGLARNGDNCV